MAQTDSLRCMDDFLINPTISAEHDLQQPSMSSTKQQSRSTSGGKGKAAVHEAMAFDFWPTYTSDEEATSPLDDDSASQYSISSDFSMPEVLEVSSQDVMPQCQRAQTVVIQSAGRARMVSMPKVVDTTRHSLCIVPAGEQKRPSIKIPLRKASIAKPRSARTSQDTTDSSSRNNSLCSAAPSPVSTAPSSVYDDVAEEMTTTQNKRASRHVDLMQAARTISPTSPASPMLPRASTFGSLPSAPSIRRKSKFTSGFTLNRIGNALVRRESNVEDMDSIKPLEPVSVTRNVTQPKRYSSGRPKLVARAANERAPTIVLPPFPEQ